MKKLFVSLPMRGYSDEYIIAQMNFIKQKVEENTGETFELIDQLFQEDPPKDIVNNCWYLGNSITKLAYADLVVFHPDWNKATGCIVERVICDMYNIPHVVMIEQTDEKPDNSQHLHLV